MEKQKINKAKILEQMAKEIGYDTYSLAKKVGKGIAYVSTAPIIGLLNPSIREKFYDSENLELGAQIMSVIGEFASLGAIQHYFDNSEGKIEGIPFYLGLGIILEGGIRVLSSICGTKLGSIEGYIPSKAMGYIYNKYDSVKSKLEQMKGGNE